MHLHDISNIFQGVTSLLDSSWPILLGRVGLMLLGMLLVYLGKKGVLEPLLMIPMGIGMCAVNAGVLFLDPTTAAAVTEARPTAKTKPARAPMTPPRTSACIL